jgi:hypothetical protein
MSQRLQLCDLTLNDTRASIFQVAHHDTICLVVELSTNQADSERLPEQPIREDIVETLRRMAFESSYDLHGLGCFLEDSRPFLVEGSEFATNLETTANDQVAQSLAFIKICHTTADLIEHLDRGHSLDSFIAAHCHEPGDTPEIIRLTHEQDHEPEIGR